MVFEISEIIQQFDYKINGTYLMEYETTQGGTSIERAGRFNHDIDGYSLPEYKLNLFALMEKNLNKLPYSAQTVLLRALIPTLLFV